MILQFPQVDSHSLLFRLPFHSWCVCTRAADLCFHLQHWAVATSEGQPGCNSLHNRCPWLCLECWLIAFPDSQEVNRQTAKWPKDEGRFVLPAQTISHVQLNNITLVCLNALSCWFHRNGKIHEHRTWWWCKISLESTKISKDKIHFYPYDFMCWKNRMGKMIDMNSQNCRCYNKY